MTPADLITLRLINQKLVNSNFEKPENVVSWFGAMQSQDFAAAKWALSLRTNYKADREIESMFNQGKILRTHVMRPTWHFVAPNDIRWLLALTSENVKRFNGNYFRRSGYDREVFKKSNTVIRKALEKNGFMTRNELKLALEKSKIPLNSLGLSFVMMQAELEGIIISGPKRDKQFTYALLKKRAPKAFYLEHEEALKELVKRYFQSHGPAQIQDFVWWSGISAAKAKKEIEKSAHKLKKADINGKDYFYLEPAMKIPNIIDTAYLIPGFDEYFIAYRDRTEILDQNYAKHLNLGGGMINGAVIVNGRMVGTWKRLIVKNEAKITIKLFEKISNPQTEALNNQALKYGNFVGLPVTTNYE